MPKDFGCDSVSFNVAQFELCLNMTLIWFDRTYLMLCTLFQA